MLALKKPKTLPSDSGCRSGHCGVLTCFDVTAAVLQETETHRLGVSRLAVLPVGLYAVRMVFWYGLESDMLPAHQTFFGKHCTVQIRI